MLDLKFNEFSLLPDLMPSDISEIDIIEDSKTSKDRFDFLKVLFFQMLY